MGYLVVVGIGANDREDLVRGQEIGRKVLGIEARGRVVKAEFVGSQILIHAAAAKVIGVVDSEEVTDRFDDALTEIKTDAAVRGAIGEELSDLIAGRDGLVGVVALDKGAADEAAHGMGDEEDAGGGDAGLLEDKVDEVSEARGGFFDAEAAAAGLVKCLRGRVVEAVDPDGLVGVGAVGADVLVGAVEDLGVTVVAAEADEGTAWNISQI